MPFTTARTTNAPHQGLVANVASPTLPLASTLSFQHNAATVAGRIIGNGCANIEPHPDLLPEMTTSSLGIQVPGIDASPDLDTEEAEVTEDE